MILVVRIGRLGDFLVAIPALDALRKRMPDEKIVLLTGLSSSSRVTRAARPYTESEYPPWVQWVYPRFVDAVIPTGPILSLRSNRALRKRLKAEGVFDRTYVLAYYNELLSSRLKKVIWLRLLGVRGEIYSSSGFKQSSVGVSAQMQTPWQIVHLPETSNRVLSSGDLPKLQIRSAAIDWAEKQWNHIDFDPLSGPLVVISAGATHEHKRWPEERFIDVAAELVKRVNARVILVGTVSDLSRAQRILTALPAGRARELCGKTTLEELAALIAKAHLVVGNDGGTSHLAAAVGTPCVTIMSGVHAPGVWEPSGHHSVGVRAPALPCIGCGSEFNCPLKHSRCVIDISTRAVIDESLRMLGAGLSNQ